MLLVAITLIFLTVQVRQNTKALKSSAASSAHEQVGTQIYRPLATNESLADIFVRGLDDPSRLSTVETARFFAFWQNALFTMQNWFYQWRQGALDEAFWTSWSKIMVNNAPTPGFACSGSNVSTSLQKISLTTVRPRFSANNPLPITDLSAHRKNSPQ